MEGNEEGSGKFFFLPPPLQEKKLWVTNIWEGEEGGGFPSRLQAQTATMAIGNLEPLYRSNLEDG